MNLAKLNLGHRYNVFRNHPRGESMAILQSVSAIFGIDEPNEHKRLEFVKEELIPLLLEHKNKGKLDKVIKELPNYQGWTGSGAHRFMPVAVVIGNMLEKDNIFSPKIIDSLPKEIQNYLKSFHPLYANNLNENDLPQIKLDIPKIDSYTWLDIGSAPKTGGAPTLNILKNCFGSKLNITGTDISFPIFELDDKKNISKSQYCSIFGTPKRTTFVNGIKYCNGKSFGYNIYLPFFMFGKKFNFISMCMVLPQLAKDEQYNEMPFTSLKITSENSSFTPILKITTEQQKSLDTILSHLAINGIFIGDLRTQILAKMNKTDLIDSNQEGLMFIIQRLSKDEFKIYDQCPIIFNPDLEKFPSSKK